jgi:hypothetical protein
MKTITPVSVWHNGTSVSADTFELYCINNDLDDSAQFYFSLQANGEVLTNGNLTMDGADYTSMNSSSDSKTYCWDWAATRLSLTII